jgi:fructoselysine 6-kinase
VRLATVGDVGIDIYENLGRAFPGGIGLNFAMSANELGAEEVFLYCCLGDDEFGDFVAEALGRSGLTVRAQRRPGASSTQRLTVHPDGNREFTGYFPNVLADWLLTDEEIAELRTMDVIAAPVSDGLRPVAEQVIPLEFSGRRVIDFSEDGVWWGAEYFERMAPRLDIAFFGVRSGVPPSVPGLARRYPDRPFVVTLGAEGSVAFVGERVFREPAQPTTVVDTCGCGDAFQAAFTIGYLRHGDVARALAEGTTQAGVHMQHFGANALQQSLDVGRPSG